ncbi:MAG: hypothetical protein AB7K68_04205 [Bacteriovoracia bacterium]
MKKLLLALTAIAHASLVSACSTSPTPRNMPVTENKDIRTVEAKYAASELGAQEVAEIRFPKNSTRIRKAELRKLNAALVKAQAAGKIEEIKVIAWADREFPSFNSGSLPKADQALAERRTEEIGKALANKVKDVDVDKYNMAVYPTGVDRLFKTSDFRVKRSLEQAGIPNSDSGVKTPAMSGKALVMILLEKKPAPASN